MTDWYKDRRKLRSGMVFRTADGDIVRLDRTVPGDGTKWYVEDWDNGWLSYDSTIEPGELTGEPDCCPDALTPANNQVERPR